MARERCRVTPGKSGESVETFHKTVSTCGVGVRQVAPAHCTGNLAFKIFRDLYGENCNYAGLESEVIFPH